MMNTQETNIFYVTCNKKASISHKTDTYWKSDRERRLKIYCLKHKIVLTT